MTDVGSPLARRYDVAMLDLDGVVYIGGAAVPGAPEGIAAARLAGMRIAFITNNASRSTATVAAHLTELGVDAVPEDVVSSAQAASTLLRDRFGAAAPVAVLGAEGLRGALADVGLDPVAIEEEAVAVVSGYGPDVPWRDIMRAATRVRDGLPWFACNTDSTIPAPYGVAPGHGVLVDLIRRFSGVEPVVAGKPARPLLDETVRRTGARRPLMVGDRLDTDIAGAVGAGIDSLLVMTGVTGLAELVAAAPGERPTYLSADLSGLMAPAPAVEVVDGSFAVGGWSVSVSENATLQVAGSGSTSAWWQAVAAAAWDWLDTSGSPADPSGLEVPEQVTSSA